MRIERFAGANGTAPSAYTPDAHQRSVRVTARLRSERGGILALTAMIIPAFLLLFALVLDAGTWYTHKRSLQNRADAGALAAGVEYLSQLTNCAANPTGPAATAISGKAKLYAGTTTRRLQRDRQQAVRGDGEDQRREPHGHRQLGRRQPVRGPRRTVPPNPISPNGGIWTDVIVRESNLGTVAGGSA